MPHHCNLKPATSQAAAATGQNAPPFQGHGGGKLEGRQLRLDGGQTQAIPTQASGHPHPELKHRGSRPDRGAAWTLVLPAWSDPLSGKERFHHNKTPRGPEALTRVPSFRLDPGDLRAPFPVTAKGRPGDQREGQPEPESKLQAARGGGLRAKPRARGRESLSRLAYVGRESSRRAGAGPDGDAPSRLGGRLGSASNTAGSRKGVYSDRPPGEKRRVRGERSGPRPDVGRKGKRVHAETRPGAEVPVPACPSPPTHPSRPAAGSGPYSPSPRLRLRLGPTPHSERLFRFRLRPPPVAAPPPRVTQPSAARARPGPEAWPL